MSARALLTRGWPIHETEVAEVQRLEPLLGGVRVAMAVWATLRLVVFDVQQVDRRTVVAAATLYVFLAASGIVMGHHGRRVTTPRAARSVAVRACVGDTVVIGAAVLLFAHYPTIDVWALLLFIPVEAALRFELTGAVLGWIAAFSIQAAQLGLRGAPGGWGNQLSFRGGLLLLGGLLVAFLVAELRGGKQVLADTLEELRRADAWRTRMVSTLAHDVRGPLGTLVQTAETLRARAAQLDPDTHDQLVGGIARQGAHVQHLANDLLDLARLEHGTFELRPEPTDVAALLERAVSYLAETHDVEVRAPAGLVATLDPGRIEQVVVNLVTNALRHGAPPVTVEAGAHDGSVTIAVADEGPGVTPTLVPDLFTPFAGSDGPASTGLGLWIVRELVRLHGGQVRYEPNVPTGARFTVELPLSPPRTQPPPEPVT